MLLRPNLARFLASLRRCRSADAARGRWQFRRRRFHQTLTRPGNRDLDDVRTDRGLASATTALSRNPRVQIREPQTIGSVDDEEERRNGGFLENARETVLILVRIVVVSSVVTILVAAYLITRLTRVNLFPAVLRTGIEFLGPIFVKFGQWISTRRDIIPRDICDALSRLQRDVTPHSWMYTERLLEATYGSSWRDLFTRFDDEGLIGSGCCAQIFKDNFIHCDLHPGNILVEKAVVPKAGLFNTFRRVINPDYVDGPRLIILDCGLVVSLNDRCRQNLRHVFYSVLMGNGEMAAQYILEHSSHMTPDPDGFRRSMRNIVKFHLRNPFNVNVSTVVSELFSAMVRHRVKQDGSFSGVILSMLMIEGLGRCLDPNIDIFAEILPFVFGSVYNDSK
ncbi:unnamed protein product [Lasius platythorax]|uniref:ABC1 atypical kinase-like domain-containing protein n=1 Tax=Lasius platythorax TaxID=488582 RepID=A0AAV2P3B4_9HYME